MREQFELEVNGTDLAQSQVLAAELASTLRLTTPGVQVERVKTSDDTMDIGTVVGVIIASNAVAALARGLAAWLAKRQSAEIRVRKDGTLMAKGLTSADALRLAQILASNE
jgi:hypothetical protein